MLRPFFAICCNVAIVVLSVYFLQSSKKEQIEKRLILLLYPQCYSQWVNRAPLCIILKIKIWVVAYLKFIIFFPSFKKTFLVYFMQLFSADAAMFLKKTLNIFLPTKSWKNHPQKLLRNTQIHFFFLTASTAQMAQTEEYMFQNLIHWTTV